MDSFSAVALILHSVSAVIWIGGMFFAYMVLRPSMNDMVPPDRMKLWRQVFPRFFFWVWMAIIIMPITGYGMLFIDLGGFDGAGPRLHAMQLIGWTMIIVFLYLVNGPFRRFADAVDNEDWATGGMYLGKIRHIVAVNMTLGILNLVIGESAPFWG